MEIDDAQKRFHNVIIFRPLEPLTDRDVGTREGYAKVHESAVLPLQPSGICRSHACDFIRAAIMTM